MSPIRLCHVSLTHPQSPINRSILKAFQHTKTSWERSWKTSRYLEHKQNQRRFSSTEALLESSLEASRNFKNLNFEYKEHSKRNHLNHLSRSQRSLESSSKASINFKKLQIGETLRIQATKTPKNFHHKPSNKKNFEEKSSKSSS